MDWLKNLLMAHQHQDHLVLEYLKIYYEVVDQHLGNRALPLSAWLENQLKGNSVTVTE